MNSSTIIRKARLGSKSKVRSAAMTPRRVFIFWEHPIFHDAVRALLNHPDIQWVGASSNYSEALNLVPKACADTILVEEVEGSIPVEIMGFLENSLQNLRIVGLNIHDNRMRVYRRVQHIAGRAEDLLDLILNDSTEEDVNEKA